MCYNVSRDFVICNRLCHWNYTYRYTPVINRLMQIKGYESITLALINNKTSLRQNEIVFRAATGFAFLHSRRGKTRLCVPRPSASRGHKTPPRPPTEYRHHVRRINYNYSSNYLSPSRDRGRLYKWPINVAFLKEIAKPLGR